MRKTISKAAVLLFAAGVSLSALSSCSVILPLLEDSSTSETSGNGGGGGNGGGSGGSGVAGTYQIDVAAYDSSWSGNVVDSSMWNVTAGVGAYAYDTLVLNSDYTYELTKEMGADEVAIARWSADGGVTDQNYNKYTYYGTYTVASDGVTVTLSECTSIYADVRSFNMSLEYDLGNYEIYDLYTDDLTTGAGTMGGELVVDFIYGIYIADSGYGNVAQNVTLGATDYGDFAFSGLAETEGGDDDTGGETGGETGGVTIPEGGYAFTPQVNDTITFNVYADGTYFFAYADYNVTETGTYTWDRLTKTFTITDPLGAETVATVDGDVISFTYFYSASTALNQAYVGSVSEMEAVILTQTYKFIPWTSNNYSLIIYNDETYTYTDAANGISETGTYDWAAAIQQLTLILPNNTRIAAESTTGNIIKIDYVAAADSTSTETFIASAEELLEALPSAAAVYEFGATSVSEGNSMSFVIYNDYTFVMSYYLYGNEGDVTGTWTFDGSSFACALSDGTEQTVTTEGDVISIAFYYYGLSQTFVGSLAALRAATGYYEESEDATQVYHLEPTSVSGDNTMDLYLYDDGTISMDYNLYGYGGTDSGWYAWYDESSTLVIVYSDYNVAYSYIDDTDSDILYVDYVSPASSALSQTFKGSVSGLSSALANVGAVYEFSATSVSEGNSMTFVIYDNGTFIMEYYLYGYSGEVAGTWTFDGSNFACATDDGSTQTVTTSDDVVSIYFDYYGMTQTFVGSLAALRAATGYYEENENATQVYAFEATSVSSGNSMALGIYDDGTFGMDYYLYGSSGTDSGWYAWYDESSTFVLVYSDYTVAYSYADSSDSDVIYIDYVMPGTGGALSQTFQGSVSAIKTALN